ncbi:DUF2293 domain-containing protein [Lichenihabitans psoromatis]|uniref:DUF2293 domain-containing protein n=1 Tax=Lichenihabitans psoromatis TaxID=2528642 RepID=UPI0010384A48|nr:DUF2293 domain-containing protein [Lichenihabitans psoromatis]
MTRQTSLETALRRLAPAIPAHEFAVVVDHACGSPALKRATPEEAAWLSLVAYIRHRMTDYDELLADHYDVDSARYFVADDMREILRDWGVRRALAPDGGDGGGA